MQTQTITDDVPIGVLVRVMDLGNLRKTVAEHERMLAGSMMERVKLCPLCQGRLSERNWQYVAIQVNGIEYTLSDLKCYECDDCKKLHALAAQVGPHLVQTSARSGEKTLTVNGYHVIVRSSAFAEDDRPIQLTAKQRARASEFVEKARAMLDAHGEQLVLPHTA